MESDPNSRPAQAAGPVALGFGALALGAAALAGGLDVHHEGDRLSRHETLAALGMWLLIGGVVAAPLVVALWTSLRLFSRWLPAERAGVAITGTALLGAVLASLRVDFLSFSESGVLLLLLAAWGLWSWNHPARPALRVLRTLGVCLVAVGFSAARVAPADSAESLRARPDPAAAPVEGVSLPSMVVILLDTQRADYLGPYRPDRKGTPVLAALAAESVVYERAFSQAPWTVPSHATLFTGLYPVTHGCSGDVHRWLDDEFQTLAEELRSAGYRTAGFSANPWIKKANLHQGFDVFVPVGARFRTLFLRELLQLAGMPALWADQGAADAAVQLEQFFAANQGETAPLLLFINLAEPHWKHLPVLSDRLDALPADLSVVEATRLSADYSGPLAMAGQRVSPRLPEALRALYAGAVAYQDRVLGRMLETLRENLDLDQTLLVVTADHGENLGEAGRYEHCFAVNDYLLHVPLIVRYPPLFPPGLREPGLCELLDLHVTLRELSGRGVPAELPGRSLVPGRFQPREHIRAQGDPFVNHLASMSMVTGMRRDVAEFAASQRVVRGERFKLVDREGFPPRLYDLDRDPDEADNVLLQHPDEAHALQAVLERWWTDVPAYVPRDREGLEGEELSAEDEATLRALGYVK